VEVEEGREIKEEVGEDTRDKVSVLFHRLICVLPYSEMYRSRCLGSVRNVARKGDHAL
jgi:hypothetical protein